LDSTRPEIEMDLTMDLTKSDELLAYLKANGIAATTYDHAPVHTVEESRELRGDIPGVHTKNLFLRDGKKNFFLFVTDEGASINLKALAKLIGAKAGLSFGSPEALLEHLGITPGSVSVLAAINDIKHTVTIVLDEKLFQSSPINCHPLTNSRTTSLTKHELETFLDRLGRKPLLVSLATDTPV
jgi:Ala-tRNA(Pro) deacylase